VADPDAPEIPVRAQRETHWEGLYRVKQVDQVSWYRPHLEHSLRLIRQLLPAANGRIIDVGAGASTLVDDLLAVGYRSIDVLDLSATAIEVTRRRVGAEAGGVRWLVGDVTSYPLDACSYDLWHDRAVFHFLTRPEDRDAYIRQVTRALRPGGHIVIATFGPQGPTRCSGLEVERYGADSLGAQFGDRFMLCSQLLDVHRSPAGAEQQFLYCAFKLLPERSAS